MFFASMEQNMSVLDVEASADGPRMNITWSSPVVAIAISVQVAKSTDMLDTMRHFVLPVVNGITLDLGAGPWFFRVGVWSGSPQAGSIAWSGIYGPLTLPTPKMSVGARPSAISVLHTQAITRGVRIHTGIHTPYYAIIDVSKGTDGMGAGTTKTQYAYDTGRGFFDIVGLDPAHTYNFKIFSFQESPSELPTDSIKQLGSGVVSSQKRPARYMPARDSSVSTSNKAEDTMLKDLARQSRLTFSSHAEYVKYISAKARTSEEKLL